MSRATDKAEKFFANIPHRKKRAFLIAYAICGTVLGAAESAHVDRASHRNWLKDDIEYVEAFAQAKEMSIEILEKEARRRAHDGIIENVYQGGQKVGENVKYSDTLLMFLLNGERPAKYKQRFEHTGPGGGPMQNIVHTGIDLSTVSDEELDKELERLDRLTKGIDAATD